LVATLIGTRPASRAPVETVAPSIILALLVWCLCFVRVEGHRASRAREIFTLCSGWQCVQKMELFPGGLRRADGLHQIMQPVVCKLPDTSPPCLCNNGIAIHAHAYRRNVFVLLSVRSAVHKTLIVKWSRNLQHVGIGPGSAFANPGKDKTLHGSTGSVLAARVCVCELCK
jgi:hypothetical protein